MTADLQQQLADAERQLELALRSGADTAPVRNLIGEIQAEITAAAAASQRAELQTAHGIQRAAAARARERLSDLLAQFPPVPKECHMEFAQNIVPPEYEYAISRLDAAQRALDKAVNRQNESQQEFDHLRDRIAELSRERDAIGQRRRRGDVRRDDAGAVAVLDMDLAGVSELQARSGALLSSATTDVRVAAERVTETKIALKQVERKLVAEAALEALKSLDQVADKLLALVGQAADEVDASTALALLPRAIDFARAADGRLLRAVDHLKTLEWRSGRRSAPLWGASQALLLRLRNIAAQRNEL